MDDEMIIKLFWDRDENAIRHTDDKYGKLCYSISYGVLECEEDAKECVNDTYLSVWNSIPPQKPNSFPAFISRITRNISINRYNYNNAQRRKSDYEKVLDEVNDFTPNEQFTESVFERNRLRNAINDFVSKLPMMQRVIFVRRYWYLSSVKQIAKDYSLGESAVKAQLMRIRNKFREYLEKEGFTL